MQLSLLYLEFLFEIGETIRYVQWRPSFLLFSDNTSHEFWEEKLLNFQVNDPNVCRICGACGVDFDQILLRMKPLKHVVKKVNRWKSYAPAMTTDEPFNFFLQVVGTKYSRV